MVINDSTNTNNQGVSGCSRLVSLAGNHFKWVPFNSIISVDDIMLGRLHSPNYSMCVQICFNILDTKDVYLHNLSPNMASLYFLHSVVDIPLISTKAEKILRYGVWLTFHIMLQLDKIHRSQGSFCVVRGGHDDHLNVQQEKNKQTASATETQHRDQA